MSQEYKESGETRKEEGKERARNIRKVERHGRRRERIELGILGK